MYRTLIKSGFCLVLVALVGVAVSPSMSDAAPGGGNQKGNIEGVVVDQNNDPVAGATVQLFADIPGLIDYLAETTTDSDGEFRFRRLAPDDYSVVATLLTPSFACSGSASVTVVAKQTVNVTVTVTCQSF